MNDILDDGGAFISLIKPQFEAGAENIGKGGIVKNRRVHINVINDLITRAEQRALMIRGVIPSPIKGGDGNIEYLAFFEKGGAKEAVDVFACVDAAFGGNK